MKFCLRIVLLLFLLTGTLTQDGFDLSAALDDTEPTPAKPKEQPKAPEKPKTDGFDLSSALDDKEPTPAKPKEQPKPSGKPKTDEDFDLSVALDNTNPNPTTDKPAVKPPPSGGGGSFDDNDLSDVANGDYKPDGGRSGGGGAVDPGHDTQAGTGQIAGIVSAIGAAILGAATSYFAYQKKKLCFKLQGGEDPESGKDQHGTQSEPQVLSNLLKTS
ncbi:hypothetical protein PAMP_016174 [Pampus punctatissimus]